MTDQPVLPGPPQEPQLPEDDPRTELVQRVRSALMVLPGFFEFGTHFEGIDATDLFSLNSVLGASIEGQVVRTLNKMRNEWDPDEHWTGYRFVRQSQTFPDVLLARQGVGTSAIAMGIELKGWYLLSKEGVGSFRFQVTPAACSIFDLIMIVPWRLSNIMSGTPVASEPWVASARYAAELRNYWWQHVRETKHPRAIIHPADVQPYPTKDISILDVPEYDGGGNFGRLPRVVGLMTDFVAAAKTQEALGIPISDWISFLQLHSENSDPGATAGYLLQELRSGTQARSEEAAQQVLLHLGELVRLMAPGSSTSARLRKKRTAHASRFPPGLALTHRGCAAVTARQLERWRARGLLAPNVRRPLGRGSKVGATSWRRRTGGLAGRERVARPPTP